MAAGRLRRQYPGRVRSSLQSSRRHLQRVLDAGLRWDEKNPLLPFFDDQAMLGASIVDVIEGIDILLTKRSVLGLVRRA
jgi:hypothetical protein